MAYTISGRLYPNPGECLRHKTMGFEGTYEQEVFTNKDKRHFKVVSDDGKKTYVLPDKDWELITPGE